MPGNAFFDRNLGRILEQEGRLDEALLAYESAVAKDPESEFYAKLVDNLSRRLQR
jgi:tetratricopeptide (TPR) repeat protein